MSRIRTVKGTITKTTGRDHNIYSDGNIVYNSGKAITETSDAGIVYGDPQKAPVMSIFKKIVNVKWMCAEMKEEINTASIGNKVSLLIRTCHYKNGEIISLKIKEIDDKEIKGGEKELTYKGIVDEDGYAELKEQVEI
ncbi:hypothetical protein HNQ02_003739 [Flavobacterium sp. 7E]|uniref:hypothetical protein n=1 Tax=Flavobacterium sp. 7E TaxID=2735898 RepID=UPI00156F58AF|nr:hypothetical protein [Flavobacterium sp. 7E]NRS90792.1 hypothetical protein [Flavobacterium sp. 7E]